MTNVPEGWKLVPVEPTIAMLMAGRDPRISTEHDTRESATWAAMLFTAPQPPAQPVKRLSADEIRAVFLSHGFEVKPGFDDLKPYVYVTARAVETALAAAWGVKLED